MLNEKSDGNKEIVLDSTFHSIVNKYTYFLVLMVAVVVVGGTNFISSCIQALLLHFFHALITDMIAL